MTPSTIISLEPQFERAPDCIKVFVRECQIELSVGYNAREKLQPQPVIVDLEVEAALPHRYQELAENSLDRVIDYSRLYHFITDELPKMGHITLLETVAEQIIAFCFEDRRITRARVRLEKPQIYAGKARAGIEVSRSRPVAST